MVGSSLSCQRNSFIIGLVHQPLSLQLRRRVEGSGALNFNVSRERQLVGGNTGTGLRQWYRVNSPDQLVRISKIAYRLGVLSEELVVDLVDGGKVLHVVQEDVDLDNILQAASGLLKHSSKVLERLSLSSNIE